MARVELMSRDEIIATSQWSMFGDQHYVTRISGKKWMVDVPGIVSPMYFRRKCDAESFVNSTMKAITHRGL